MDHSLRAQLEKAIRTIPDYPQKGIMFRDITTLLGDASINKFSKYSGLQPDLGA